MCIDAPNLSYWMGQAANRASETGQTLTHRQIKRVAEAMVRIEASKERVAELDMYIRFNADPTGETAVRNVMADNALNAARRVAA